MKYMRLRWESHCEGLYVTFSKIAVWLIHRLSIWPRMRGQKLVMSTWLCYLGQKVFSLSPSKHSAGWLRAAFAGRWGVLSSHHKEGSNGRVSQFSPVHERDTLSCAKGCDSSGLALDWIKSVVRLVSIMRSNENLTFKVRISCTVSLHPSEDGTHSHAWAVYGRGVFQ